MSPTIIKSLLFGFLPILVFVIVETLYNLKIALISAIIVSVLELLRSKLIDKKINSFLFIDLFFIVGFGGISLWADDPLFFKLKPAALQVFLILLCLFALFKPMYINRYMSQFKLNITDPTLILPVLRLLLSVLCVHTALIIYAAYYLSNELWAFISGPLFYILIALAFLYVKFLPSLKLIYWKRFYANDEWIPIITPNGSIKFYAPRTVAHTNASYLHPTVHILFTKNKKVYLQKRGLNKDVFPGRWDSSVGGHVSEGETIEDALKKECYEELGIQSFKFSLIKTFMIKDKFQSELIYLFHGTTQQEFSPNMDEIADGKYFSVDDIEAMDKTLFTPHFIEEELPELRKLI